ncbi:sugar ABC transporter substrate-binding protein [Exiguobacterium alkaliphilum]|uniref:Substrate-binding domain-containing protein n=1 Tax=Exiguobacterium alkaliphilum TaxID=1428684 RepID=A0ABT2KZX1_9BACL|nr:substrate-binding domain-containing protein [Exiguobacterium alkaliphilum]MCT4796462.1 substrate-binding domain-containing protein [Exiguobacterium alkaliphilum]
MKGFRHYWLWLPVVWAMTILLITSIQLPEQKTKDNEVGFVFVSDKHEHANKLLAAFVRTANQKGFIPVPTTSEDSRVLEKEKLDSLIDRSLGLTEYDRAHDELEVVASLTGNFDTFQAEIEMSRWLKEDIPFDAVFSHNDDNTFGVVRALESRGLLEKTIVSVDGVTEIYPLIHSGKVDATVVQSPNEMIEVGFKALEQHLSGKKISRHYYSSSYLYEGLIKD